MTGEFKIAEWNSKPPEVQRLRHGGVRVTRNVEAVERDDETVWRGECAIMSDAAYAAYVGAREVEQRRESEVIDDYTLALIEEGVL